GGRREVAVALVAGNVVRAVVPVTYDRDRHGIFAGNVGTLNMYDNTLTLRRIPPGAPDTPTPVEGVRVFGTLGSFVSIRHTSLAGFDPGVRVVALPPLPDVRMWLVGETVALGATTTLDAPPEVDRERNVP